MAAARRAKYNFADAEVDYRAGSMSVNAIATKHSIPESSLRAEAKRLGWVKGLAATKRAMVADAMAGGDPAKVLASCEVRRNQLSAAEQDILDMNNGLAVARGCITALMAMVAEVSEPRDVKTIVEANKSAIETIRKIRGLDDAPPTQEDAVSALISAINGTSLPVVK